MPPAGWYPDPAGGGRLRYFDGNAWTSYYHPAGPPQSPPVPATPPAPAASASPAVSAAPTGRLHLGMPPPHTGAYLVQIKTFYPGQARATLELTDTHLRCMVNEYSGWVENALGITDLESRLSGRQPLAAFAFRRDALNIKWLKISAGTTFEVSEGDSPHWRVSFLELYQYGASVRAVQVRPAVNQWRQALSPPKRHGA